MQPLYSVDHETRQNSHRGEEPPAPQEDTPLLHRFPATYAAERNPVTTVIVGLLLTILLVGVIIGIYLLTLQSNSENVLPPVETPLQLVSRSQWDHSGLSRPLLSLSPIKAKQVIVLQTDTDQCGSTAACTNLLKKLQANLAEPDQLLPYNFLLSSNGQTYESLGWHKPSPLFPQYQHTMVLAFIGNFTETPPTQYQMDEAANFFSESVSQLHLAPSFDIIGRNTTYKPTRLFQAMRTFPQWNDEQSDV